MTESNDTRTTFEQAKDCPKCGKTGVVKRITNATNSAGRPVKIHLVYCETELCPWYQTCWPVQVNEDGSIPEPYSQIGEKQYHRLSQESMTKMEESILRQIEAETRGNRGPRDSAEIRNPRS